MIKSGAVVQNRYLNNGYQSNYNPLGRPGNFDVARPSDTSAVFDTGMPKDVSPYQPRVAKTVSIQPNSVFKPKRFQKSLKQINNATLGQTFLKSIFGGEENVITDYMAQRLLGIVDNDSRKLQSMQQDSVDNMELDSFINPLLDFRDPNVASTASTTNVTQQSDSSMAARSTQTSPPELANLTNLSLGEMPLQIAIEDRPPGFNPFFLPENQPTEITSAPDEATMDAVAAVETQPAKAAELEGMLGIPPPPPPPPLILQQTDAGLAKIKQRERSMDGAGKASRFDVSDLAAAKLKLKKPAQVSKKIDKEPSLQEQMKATLMKRRQRIIGSDS